MWDSNILYCPLIPDFSGLERCLSFILTKWERSPLFPFQEAEHWRSERWLSPTKLIAKHGCRTILVQAFCPSCYSTYKNVYGSFEPYSFLLWPNLSGTDCAEAIYQFSLAPTQKFKFSGQGLGHFDTPSSIILPMNKNAEHQYLHVFG